MKSVITGGAGFIGSHLAEAISKLGHQVFVLDNFCTGRMENLANIRHKIEIIDDSIDVYGAWSRVFKDADWVFHLAALADIVPSIEKLSLIHI